MKYKIITSQTSQTSQSSKSPVYNGISDVRFCVRFCEVSILIVLRNNSEPHFLTKTSRCNRLIVRAT